MKFDIYWQLNGSGTRYFDTIILVINQITGWVAGLAVSYKRLAYISFWMSSGIGRQLQTIGLYRFQHFLLHHEWQPQYLYHWRHKRRFTRKTFTALFIKKSPRCCMNCYLKSTFKNSLVISWRSALVVGETGVPLSPDVISSTPKIREI